jgi:hypothetical protein
VDRLAGVDEPFHFSGTEMTIDGIMVGLAFVVATVIGVLAYDAGKRSVLYDCESYGKSVVNRTMLVCSKQ